MKAAACFPGGDLEENALSGHTRHYWTNRSTLFPFAPDGGTPALPVHPVFRQLPPPVIVVGMHGSGSSIVSRILAELGVYMGSGLDEHAEAAEFFALNEELLYRANASWHRPDPFLTLREEPGFSRSALLRLVGATYGQLRSRYLAGLLRDPRSQWGWKDPRTSLTLPYWLHLFPHARVLHILRDPERAAASIHWRALREASQAPGHTWQRPWLSRAGQAALHLSTGLRTLRRWTGQEAPYPPEDPCLDLEHCRKLARGYVDACYRARDLGGPRLEVRYEALLERPVDTVQMLAAFTLGDVPESRIRAAAALVRSPAVTEPEVAGLIG